MRPGQGHDRSSLHGCQRAQLATIGFLRSRGYRNPSESRSRIVGQTLLGKCAAVWLSLRSRALQARRASDLRHDGDAMVGNVGGRSGGCDLSESVEGTGGETPVRGVTDDGANPNVASGESGPASPEMPGGEPAVADSSVRPPASQPPASTPARRGWVSGTKGSVGICLAGAVALGLARVIAGLPWLIVVLIAVAWLGVVLWLPRAGDVDSRASAGSALATTAIISAVFFALTVRDEHNQNRLAKIAQNQQQSIANHEALTLQLTLQHNLAGIDLSGQSLNGFDLPYKDLAGANLFGIQFTYGRLRGSDLDGAILTRANLNHTGMLGASLIGASLAGADLDSANLDDADLIGANLGRSFVKGLPLKTTTLVNANLEDAGLQGACLAGADLQKATFEGTDLANADLDYTNLTGAKFLVDGLTADVRGTSFYGAEIDAGTKKLLAAYGASLSAPTTLPPQPPIPRSASTAYVTGHVTYGQGAATVELDRIGWARLIGLNAPNDDLPATASATRRIDQLLPIGHKVRYQLGRQPREPKPGGIGRALVYVWTTSGDFVNRDLLLRGDAIRETDQGGGQPLPRDLRCSRGLRAEGRTRPLVILPRFQRQ